MQPLSAKRPTNVPDSPKPPQHIAERDGRGWVVNESPARQARRRSDFGTGLISPQPRFHDGGGVRAEQAQSAAIAAEPQCAARETQIGLPEIRNPLPDMTTLRSAADGDLSALGEMAERADAIRRETRVYTPDAPSAAADALERAGARTARDLAIGETVDRAATDRLQGLETLRRALDTAPNARAVMDLNARLAAEQALIQNEQVRLQGLALTQAAEARLEDQRARERIAAERSARMDAYRQAFQ